MEFVDNQLASNISVCVCGIICVYMERDYLFTELCTLLTFAYVFLLIGH